MPAVVQGTRFTFQADAEERIVRQVHDEIGLLEPDVAPLITLLMRLKKRVPAKSPTWEWFEDDYVARWGANGDATVANSTASTTVTVTDGSIFAKGDLFIVPKPVSSAAQPELCRVTDVNGQVLTVQRAVGGDSTVDTIPPGAPLRLVGSAFEEGADVPNAKTTAPTKKLTRLQIFRTACEFSKTAIATQVYGAPNGDRAREHKKKLREHKILLNSALLFSSTSESMTANGPVRTTMGILSQISTNVTNAEGTLTRKLFESFSRQAFRYGSSRKLLLASPIVKSAINEWAREFLLVKPSETKYGIRVQQVETAHGEWMLVNDWMLENQGDYGFGSMALSIDLDQIRYLYLNNNGINRDTAIYEDIVKDGKDKVVDEILTEGGFAVMQEKYHAKLYNVTDYQ